MSNELVKQDINLMENPLWVLSEYPEKELKIVKKNGGEYVITSGYKMPERIDMNFLLFFIMNSQKNGYVQKLEFTRHEILHACGIGRSEDKYERLEDSLKRWINVVISFKGTFYNNNKYINKTFNIINHFVIDEKSKKLKLELNKYFIEEIKYSNFCRYIDFDKYKRLRKPVSSRLYEILLKNFVERQEWEIEAMNLAAKLTLGQSGNRKLYPADVKIKITPAINEINEKTELRIELETRKNKDKQLIFKFKLIKNLEIEKQEQENKEIQTLTALLKEGYENSKGISNALKKYYAQFGYDYVKYNILYANKKATKDYSGFLKSSLEENWGEGLKLEQDKTAKQEQLRQIELEEKRKIEEETRIKEELAYKTSLNIASFVNNLENQDKERFINSVFEYLQGRDEFIIAKMALNSTSKIKPATVAMFFEAFKNCYNSYIQLNSLDFNLV